jgi:hypothetical protein
MEPQRGILGFAIAAAAVLALLSACGDDDDNGSDSNSSEEPTPAAEEIDPADFQAEVTNPYFAQPVGLSRAFEGEEDGVLIRVEETVLEETETVAGVETTILEVNEYEDGELVEHTLDYYAQHVDGSVYYFGEDVDNYEDGEVVDHDGTWHAGEDGALPGLYMPANPEVGQQFEQERAPGIAEDESEIVEVGLAVETAAGSFEDCIKTEDYAPLDDATEHKYYCPDVGLVREESEEGDLLDLVEIP